MIAKSDDLPYLVSKTIKFARLATGNSSGRAILPS
jgi:hypothetical protein